MRRWVIIVVILIVVTLVAAVISVASIVRYGLSAHDHPTRMEKVIAAQLRHWAVPSDLRKLKNPVPLTPEILEESRAHFADHCALCHGNDGKGKTEMGPHMYPHAPDMTLAQTQGLSDGELFAIIENGIRLTGMPGWGNGNAESGRASWTLVHFIRHLPKVTPEEISAMEKLNPKSPEEWQEMQQEQQFLEGGTPAAEEHQHEH